MLFSACSDGGLAGAEDLGLVRIDAALGERLAERRRLRAARNEDHDRFRIEVLGALHEGGEVRVGDREAHRADDLAAGFLEGALEARLEVVAGAVVGHHRVGLLDAAFLTAQVPKVSATCGSVTEVRTE